MLTVRTAAVKIKARTAIELKRRPSILTAQQKV